MRKFTIFSIAIVFAAWQVHAQSYQYTGCWGKAGFNLTDSKATSVDVVFSVPSFSLDDITINNQVIKNINLPGTFLFNDEGMPNLPGKGSYIAIPQGSVPKLQIVSERTETIHNVEIGPAPRIPLDNDRNPLLYRKNMAVYSKNALYPASPVKISEIQKIRGVDVVILGVTPFQYNPVTRDLIVYKDIRVNISFEGGNGQFGDPAFRSRWWEPIMQDQILNHQSLPAVDFDKRYETYTKSQRDNECEYIIIIPTGADFASWADTIKNFRTDQGILTQVFTTAEIGGNTETAIESFIDNAYNNWTIKPAACLLLADYGTNDASNIISHLYSHPAGYPNFASDNKYADVDGDEMPDVVFSRICANNASQLQIMISKFLNNERTPPTDYLFYDKPITALGWQTERWFQLCSEVVGGFFRTVYGKHPRRINAIYQGTPGSIWSSATNTNTLVNYFGPNGLGYIPQTPAELGGWSGGNATMINNAIDSGAFILQHRDHGEYTGWGEPSYHSSNITQLTNTMLPFVFSINCQTGAYHRSSDCFGEVFHRHFKDGHNAGAFGIICPSEVSYSFVNDTYVWGMYDNMWPNFMPAEGTTPSSRGVMPAFGNAAGKYFLKQSNWPYNTGDKLVTYRLFHMHGDAFSVIYFQVPQALTVSHDTAITYGNTTFTITANDSALIALTANGEILATAYGLGTTPVNMTIPVLDLGTQVHVTVTKQNYFRYFEVVPVTSDILTAEFSASATSVCTGATVNFTDVSSGGPTSWEWSFEGGTPATSTDQNPQDIQYSAPGDYTVSLTVYKNGNSQTNTQPAYIHVYDYPVAEFTAASFCIDVPTQFTDASSASGGTITSWDWDFGDPESGSNNTSVEQNPAHTYSAPGTYVVTLTVLNNGTCSDQTTQEIVITGVPGIAELPAGDAKLCQGTTGAVYTTVGAPDASSYAWELSPAEAGTVTGNGLEGTVDLISTFSGSASLAVKGINNCGEGQFSAEFPILVAAPLEAPAMPVGPDTVDLKGTFTTDYITTGILGADEYAWSLSPAEAGTIAGNGTTGTVTWDGMYRGYATITAKGVSEGCEGAESEGKQTLVRSTVGIGEQDGLSLAVYPNPTTGKFSIQFRGNGNVGLKIFNVLGNVVFEESSVTVTGKVTRNLDLSGLPGGIYYLKVEGTGKPVVRKIILND
jgi:PKD repeat protein